MFFYGFLDLGSGEGGDVLKKLKKLKKQKCRFMQPSVEYLGYVTDKGGIHPMSEKVEAICEVSVTSNINEPQSFLGMKQYYAKLVDGYSTLMNNLNVLLQKGSMWRWELEQQVAFVKLKKQLASVSLLVHHSTSLKLRLACNASAYVVGIDLAHHWAVGAVISNIMFPGGWKWR